MNESLAQKNTLAEVALDGFLELICQGNLEVLGNGFHDGAAFFGFEDGLFITADRYAYLDFVRMMRNEREVSRSVEWRHQSGRIAAACIVERSGPNKRVCVMTLLHFDTGWKIVSQTFEGGTGGGL